jgi:hypothetical protein
MTHRTHITDAPISRVACLWCGRSFKPRLGGSRQRFCCPSHRNAFHTAARIWAERAVVSGVLTVSDLRTGADAACTLLSLALGNRPARYPTT